MREPVRRTWAEVSLDRISDNYHTFRNAIAPDTKIMAVVKADAYGHGAPEVARILQSEGADYLGVAFLDEARQLRQAGIELPILLLGYTAPEDANDLVSLGVTATVYNFSMAKAVSNAAGRMGKTAKIHIKIDTGMCRIGYQYYGGCEEQTLLAIQDLFRLPHLEIEGIYSHFAEADEEDTSSAEAQFARFSALLDALEERGIRIPLRHICNSAATMRFPQMHLDMVRLGISLYGVYPSPSSYPLPLKPAMALKTMITHLKRVPKGERISYGGTYTVEKDAVIATVPIGYADGFSRALSGRAEVIVGGKRVPVVGKICMDQCMIDVTSVNNICMEEEVTIFGEAGGICVSADEVAANMNAITYELLTVIGKRVPRCYLMKNTLIEVKNYLLRQ